MDADVLRDWGWADGYLPEIRRILTLNAVSIFDFQIASYQQDVKKATDMLLTVSGSQSIAVRLRRAHQHYRDLTLRAQRTSGIETELSKLQQGYGDFYLYGWTESFSIKEWMFVNLDRLRASGLLEQEWRTIANTDGKTSFIAIPFGTLLKYGCIANAHVLKGVSR